jgi:kynureninase
LYAAHKAALDIFEEAGFDAIVKKGRELSDYLLFIIDDINSRFSQPPIKIITPRIESEKGCQISMLVPHNRKKIFDALTKNGVFADWREPDVIRVAPVPLYNSFEEVRRFGETLREACRG